MANEGTASIEVVGDVRNFARDTLRKLNEALKKIKPEPVEVRADAEKARRSGEEAGDKLADGVTRGADGKLRDSRGKFVKAGEGLGKSAGDGTKRGFLDSLKRMDIKGALGSAVSKGGKAAFSTASKVIGPLASTLGTVISGALVASVGVTLGPALAGVIAAAITTVAGLGLGAGLLGLGAFALKDVDRLKKGVKDLGKTLKEVGRIAAQPLIKPFSRALSDLSETVHQLGPEFRSIFKGLAPVVRPLVDALGPFVGEIVRGLRDSLPGITAAFAGLSRALPEVGRWLGDFFRTIFGNKDLIDNTTEGLVKLVFGPLKLLGPLISGLNVAFGVYNNLLRLLAEGDYLGRLGESIMTFVDGGTGALGRISDAWEPLRAAIVRVWDTLKAFAAEDDASQLEAKFAEVVAAIQEVWAPLGEFISTVWKEAVAFIKRLWEEEFIPWWEGTAQPWLEQAIRAAFETAWDIAVDVVTGRLNLLRSNIWNNLGGWPSLILGLLNPISGIVGAIFNAAVSATNAALVRLVAAVIRFFRSIPGHIRSALSGVHAAVTGAFAGAAGWLVSAGANIINGLLNGIRAGFGRVRSLLGELTGMLPDWKGPAQVDKKILEPSGRMAMQGFEAGLSKEFASIQRTLGGVTSSLAGWASTRTAGAVSTTNMGGMTFNIYTASAAGAGAGREAAEEVLRLLAQTQLVRR